MSADSREITDTSAFQYRSLGKQVLFAIITLGFYGIYWWHVTNKQLSDGTDADFSPGMRTLGLFIPFYNLLVMWRFAKDATAVTDQDGAILFVLYLFVGPVAWYLIQSGINNVAQG